MSDNKKQHSKIFKIGIKVGAGIILIGGSSGLVFGLTASLSLNQNFINIIPYQFGINDDINSKVAADYRSLPSISYWNCDAEEPMRERNDVYNDSMIDDSNPIEPLRNSSEELYSCVSQILDDSSHIVLDTSFNQSSYLGVVNWVHQKDSELGDNYWKPGDNIRLDNTQLKNANTNGYADGYYSAKSNKPSSNDNPGFHSAYQAEINNMPSKNPADPESPKKGSLLLPGYTHETPLAAFEKEPIYKKATYTILDGGFRSNRCASVYYRADQSAFLCGIAVCQYLQDRYDEVYSKVNHGKLAVGTFGGLPLPTVTSFMGGFEWGIYIYNNFFLPKIEGYNQWNQETKEKRKVDLICVGRSESFYSNSFVSGEAKLLVQQLLMQGADAILPVAGPQTIDVVNEIRNQASPAITIGVDTDQENSDIGKYTSKSKLNYGDKIIQFSARKDLAAIGSTILQARAKGIRGYYFDEEFGVHYLEYDRDNPKALADDNNIGRSFIGNSGYATVGTIYNKGAGISQGADNVINNDGSSEVNKGTGWQSLLRALKLIDEDEKLNTYDDLINFLLETKFVEIPGHNSMNVFDFLEDNKYFVYK